MMKKSLAERARLFRRTSVRRETLLYPIMRLADVPKTCREREAVFILDTLSIRRFECSSTSHDIVVTVRIARLHLFLNI